MWCENEYGSLVNLKNANYIFYSKESAGIVAVFGEYLAFDESELDFVVLEICSKQDSLEKLKKYSRMVSAIKPRE